MKTSKRVMKAAAFLAAVMLTAGVPAAAGKGVFSAAPLTAYAEDDFTYEDNGTYSYQKYADHIVLLGSKSVKDTLEIPSSIDNLPVTAIGMYAYQMTGIKSIVFPDTIEEIGMYAFGYCDNLTSVTLPNSLKRMKLRTFESCKSLSEVNFPDHLVETSEYSFDNTPWLEAQRKKDPLVIVNGAVVDGRTCTGKVTIPSGVKYIAGSAFSKNEKITSIVIPSSVTNICEDTFWYCSNLTSAELNGAETIGWGAFGSCNKLTDLKISGKLKSIDGGAFIDNTATATITFYGNQSAWNSVQKSSDDAFLKRANIVFDESHQPIEEVAGDINADGQCDRTDAGMLLKYLLTTGTLTEDQAKIADLNKDSKLDATDFSRIKQIILNK